MPEATTILFGLPGVAVADVRVDDEGTRRVHVVTDDATAAACPRCGVFSTSLRQYRTTRPKDLPYGEEPLKVRWRKAPVPVPGAGLPAHGVHRVYRGAAAGSAGDRAAASARRPGGGGGPVGPGRGR